MTRVIAIFDEIYFFQFFGKLLFSKFMDLDDPVKLSKALNKDSG